MVDNWISNQLDSYEIEIKKSLIIFHPSKWQHKSMSRLTGASPWAGTRRWETDRRSWAPGLLTALALTAKTSNLACSENTTSRGICYASKVTSMLISTVYLHDPKLPNYLCQTPPIFLSCSPARLQLQPYC